MERVAAEAVGVTDRHLPQAEAGHLMGAGAQRECAHRLWHGRQGGASGLRAPSGEVGPAHPRGATRVRGRSLTGVVQRLSREGGFLLHRREGDEAGWR